MPELVSEDEGLQVHRRALGVDEDGLRALVLDLCAVDRAAQVYEYDVYAHRAGKLLRTVRAIPADELLYLLSDVQYDYLEKA